MSAPSPRDFYASYIVKVNGSALAQAQADNVRSVEVEQNLYLPSAACIRFYDGGPGGAVGAPALSLSNDTGFITIGAALEIQMGFGETPVTIFKGEVTSFELDIAGANAQPAFVVRGYDKGHRLHRGRVSKTYLNVADSDLVSTIAGSAGGLSASADATTVVYDTVSQNNQTYWEFLVGRARRIGYELYVDDTTLHFRKPVLTGSPVATAELWKDLISLNMRLTSGSQVSTVNVQGWDPQQKQQLVGTASTPAQVASNTAMQGGSTLSAPFGSPTKMVIANHLVVSQSEATTIAQAAFDELAGDSLQIEGEMYGNPAVSPGKLLTISALGTRFNGNYYITSATHQVEARSGTYKTQFTVTSRRANTLGELVGMAAAANWNGNGHGANQAPVVGVVTDNKDPNKKLGRVKVKLPYITGGGAESGGIQTDWARVVAPGGGTTRGVYYLPEVNDEVLVAFEQGDINRPYVLGGLWNGTDAPPKGNDLIVGADGKVNQRIIQSRTGHIITLDDTDQKEMITVVTKGGHKLTMDDTSGSPNIKVVDSSGNNSLVIDTTSNKITITATGNIELNATQDVKITGMNITLTAQQAFTAEAQGGAAAMKGLTTSIEAQTTGTVKANAEQTVQAQGELQLTSGAAVQVQGLTIQLN